ncbi:DUF2829 domain-containing protein [Xenorhabdus sp. 12]|uniref:DUF2829 domain-containing protein n=1 Tax=Xenorhabdus santafensis TaxID=2582833 RepID=A0ABU4SEU6_9GAMM|nr:MW1434 family type I TA system toxin [Xenorhabdus sp. 12]MDX7989246.1 DUF2829 domain-containing protein [Xenorhabdus sp. 12]
MSEVNKLDDKQCPFDPDQYKVKINDTVAPFSSYPWAMIQVYLGKKVYRNNWNFPVEYVRLAGLPDNDPYIEKYTPNNPIHWQPTQEDMLACDWNLMDCMLSFELTSGSGTYNNPSLPHEPVAWGYIRNIDWGHHFGELNKEKNNVTDIEKIWCFLLNNGVIFFDVRTKPNKENRQNVIDLFQSNDLWITIDNIKYNLGKSTPTLYPNTSNNENYDFEFKYQNQDAKKIGILLQQMQQTGQPKNFCLDWAGK